MASTNLPQSISEPAYVPWRDAFWSGDPRKELTVVRKALDGQSFRWFWLEDAFGWIERHIYPEFGWPYCWRTPVRKSLKLPESMIDLLAGDLARMVYAGRDRAGYERLRRGRPGSRGVYEAVLTAGLGCPAEDAIARHFCTRFAAGDGLSWPPFFPGDRSGVRVDVFRRTESAAEVARCSIGAVEPLWPIPVGSPFPALSDL
ncbi:MAG: hypothetical protein ACK4JB_17470 [Reyranella sp.]